MAVLVESKHGLRAVVVGLVMQAVNGFAFRLSHKLLGEESQSWVSCAQHTALCENHPMAWW